MPLKFCIILTENRMVYRLLPHRRVESRDDKGPGDGGGVVFLSFTTTGHSHLRHGRHPFQRRASAWHASLSAIGPD
jgi:hypothetical protein